MTRAPRPKVVALRLTAACAEKLVRQLAEVSANVIIGHHARKRMAGRDIDAIDVFRMLRTGSVDTEPIRTTRGEWQCKVTLKIRGGRSAGIVTIITSQPKAVSQNHRMGRLAMSKNTWRHANEKAGHPLRYTECGLDGVYLESGHEVVSTPYGKGVAVKNVGALLRAIGCNLARDKKTLTGKELRFLRKQMDFTQAELGCLVGLSGQQVARWEKGEYEITGPAERLIRMLFLEHQGGHVDLRKLLQGLRDAPPHKTIVFEKTAKGWHAKKAA